MTNTTIDGLKRRTSSTAGHRTRIARSARPSSIPKVEHKYGDVDGMASLEKDWFGSPDGVGEDLLDGFDTVKQSAVRTDFVRNTTEDWSELLGEMASNAENIPKETADTRRTRRAPKESRPSLVEPIDKHDSWAELLEQSIEDTPEEDARSTRKTRRRKKEALPVAKKKRHIGRFVAISLLMLLVGGGVVLYFWGDAIMLKLTGGRSGLWGTISAIVSDEIPFETDENGRTNVLIFGTEGYNMDGEVGNGRHDGSQLTDSIMVASFDQNTKDVALLSLPRDLKVIRACSAGKINEVFWCNNQGGSDEEAGAQALMEQVGEILGVKFQYFAHVNWGSLVSIIDTLGGITVTLDEDINDYGWTNAIARAGEPMTVNGEQALGLARARHGTTGGDFTRGNTQQKIVGAILEKITQQGLGVTDALSIFNTLGDNLRTNFSAENIKAGLRLAKGISMNDIRQVTLADYKTNVFYVTTANINNISYVVPAAGVDNYGEISKYVEKQFSSNAVLREEAEVAIYNATQEAGRASAEKVALENAGVTVSRLGDASVGVCGQNYCVYRRTEGMPATEKVLTERYGVVIQSAEELPEELSVATGDFIVVIGGQTES